MAICLRALDMRWQVGPTNKAAANGFQALDNLDTVVAKIDIVTPIGYHR